MMCLWARVCCRTSSVSSWCIRLSLLLTSLYRPFNSWHRLPAVKLQTASTRTRPDLPSSSLPVGCTSLDPFPCCLMVLLECVFNLMQACVCVRARVSDKVGERHRESEFRSLCEVEKRRTDSCYSGFLAVGWREKLRGLKQTKMLFFDWIEIKKQLYRHSVLIFYDQDIFWSQRNVHAHVETLLYVVAVFVIHHSLLLYV